ncbi:MAG: hypothetical protein ACRDD9_23745 [Shewanella sp.]
MGSKEKLAEYLGMPSNNPMRVLLRAANFQGEVSSFYRRMKIYNDVETALAIGESFTEGLSQQLKEMLGVKGRVTIDEMIKMGGIRWDQSTILRRWRSGMTIEEATSDYCGMGEIKAELVKVMKAEPNQTISEILEANGYTATYKKIYDHIRRGKSVSDAVKIATRKGIVTRVMEAIIDPQTWVSVEEITRSAKCCKQAARMNAQYLIDNGVVKMVKHDRAMYYCDARIAGDVEPASTDRDTEVMSYLKGRDEWVGINDVRIGVDISKRWAGILLNRMYEQGLIMHKKDSSSGVTKCLYRAKVKLKWI